MVLFLFCALFVCRKRSIKALPPPKKRVLWFGYREIQSWSIQNGLIWEFDQSADRRNRLRVSNWNFLLFIHLIFSRMVEGGGGGLQSGWPDWANFRPT
jgi:hypothetical protein